VAPYLTLDEALPRGFHVRSIPARLQSMAQFAIPHH
jgi:hypothetical protein